MLETSKLQWGAAEGTLLCSTKHSQQCADRCLYKQLVIAVTMACLPYMEGTMALETLSTIAASMFAAHYRHTAVPDLYVAHLQYWRSCHCFSYNILAPVQMPCSDWQTEGRLWARQFPLGCR